MTGRISDERFTELSADYEAEQRELKERAAAIQAELSKAQDPDNIDIVFDNALGNASENNYYTANENFTFNFNAFGSFGY